MGIPIKRGVLLIGLCAVVGLGFAGVATGASSNSVSKKPWVFVISNNVLTNDWRPEMERVAEATAKLAPFKGNIVLKVVNSQPTTQAQIADLNNIIATKPSVLLIDASSATALNPTITRACDDGIKVIAFDNTVTDKCAWQGTQNYYAGTVVVGEWMGLLLKSMGESTGTIFHDNGFPGAPVSAQIHAAFLAGLAKTAPGVTVAGTYNGEFTEGDIQSGITGLLAAHPGVDGVTAEGYCIPVINAFKSAGISVTNVPIACNGYNGDMVECAQLNLKCALLSGSPTIIQVAMKIGLDAMEGKPTPNKSTTFGIPMTLYLTKQADIPLPASALKASGVKVEVLDVGKNAFPNLAAGLALPWTLPQYKISAATAAGT
jgi:ribose transport system substrate-binding protein